MAVSSLPSEAVSAAKQLVLDGAENGGAEPDEKRIIADVLERCRAARAEILGRVINGTGVLLHTNLGRAPLCPEALQAIVDVSQGYSNLEYDLDAGQRGKRFTHIERLVCKLTGGEAATVVNNNAGAVMLCLAALAGGRSALVSRGELIEIGGSFRIPDIMAASGVKLVEVGTTNKTHLKDYAAAINDDTALILKVHTSNYRILGFTQSVTGEELTELAHQHKIPVLEDLGSGLLMDLTPYGLPREPTVKEALNTGIRIAGRMIKQLKEENICDGVHIMAIGKEERVLDILAEAGIAA